MKLCPCGYLGDRFADCACSSDRVAAYRRKVSGPLLDRIDLYVEVLRPSTELISSNGNFGESSQHVRQRVEKAWALQLDRSGVSNALLTGKQMDKQCAIDEAGWALLEKAAERFNLSARGHHRVLRVARTIADLAQRTKIEPAHIAEAISLRCLARRN